MPDLASMASIDWIMMVPHWGQLLSLGAGGSEPFKGCFLCAFNIPRLKHFFPLFWRPSAFLEAENSLKHIQTCMNIGFDQFKTKKSRGEKFFWNGPL